MTELSGVGTLLRETREALGMEIDDVAQQLKFAPRQIEALESEQFDRLPGPTIARGMVRNYARLLKVDPEPLLERAAGRLRSATEPGELAARLGKPVPFSESGRRGSYAYLGLSLAILALVGTVAYQWQNEEPVRPAASVQPSLASTVSVSQAQIVSEPLAVPEPVAVKQEVPAPQKTRVEEPVATPVSRPAPPPASTSVAAAAAPVASAAPSAAAPAPVAAAEEPAAALMQSVVLQSTEESWMEVRDATGQVLLADLNPPGTERVLRGKPPFRLVLGNAQHVTLRHNDKPVDLRPHTRGDVARLTLK